MLAVFHLFFLKINRSVPRSPEKLKFIPLAPPFLRGAGGDPRSRSEKVYLINSRIAIIVHR